MTATLERYLAAVAAGDTEAAMAVALAEVDSGARPEQVMTHLVGAAQAEVGHRWEAGHWSVTQEHVATGIAEEVVSALGRLGNAPRATKGKVLVTCVEGEWHSLPARIAAHVLRRSGWDAQFVGPSVPADQLAAALHDVGPHAVAMSCVVSANLPGARRVVETARSAGTPVLAGGAGFGPDGRWARRVAANQWAPFALDAGGLLQGLPSTTVPAPPLDHGRVAEHRLLERRRTAVLAEIGRHWDGFEVSRTGDFASWAVRSLSAALLVDDRAVFDEHVDWLADAYRPHGEAEPALTDLLRLMALALDEAELPTARRWVLDAAAR